MKRQQPGGIGVLEQYPEGWSETRSSLSAECGPVPVLGAPSCAAASPAPRLPSTPVWHRCCLPHPTPAPGASHRRGTVNKPCPEIRPRRSARSCWMQPHGSVVGLQRGMRGNHRLMSCLLARAESSSRRHHRQQHRCDETAKGV